MQNHPSYNWFLLGFGLLIQIASVGICNYAFPLYVVPWMDAFGAQRSVLMLAMTGYSIMSAVLCILLGSLIDRQSPRLLVSVGVVTLAVGVWGIGMAPSPLAVIAVFTLVLPFAITFAGPLIAQTLVARHFVERRGMALGISALGTAFGGLIVPALVTELLAHYGWRTVFGILGAGVLVLAPPAWLLLPRSVAVASGPRASLRDAASLPVLLLALAYLGPLIVFIGMLHNVGTYALDLGISQQRAGAIISLASLAMAVSKFTSGALTDRINHGVLYFMLLTLSVVGLMALVAAPGPSSLSISLALVAACSGGMFPLFSAIIVDRFGPQRFGAVMGVLLAAASMSGLAPSAISLIRDLSGSYHMAFAALLPCLLPGTLSFFVVLRMATRDAGKPVTAAA